jgi:hypothetical protein
MGNSPFNWDAPAVDSHDLRLITAYQETGVPLDALVYTDKFRELVKRLGHTEADEATLRTVYLQLLGLRKRSLLPRLYESSSSLSANGSK